MAIPRQYGLLEWNAIIQSCGRETEWSGVEWGDVMSRAVVGSAEDGWSGSGRVSCQMECGLVEVKSQQKEWHVPAPSRAILPKTLMSWGWMFVILSADL